MAKTRVLKDIPELVETLREQRTREQDFVVKQDAMVALAGNKPEQISVRLKSNAEKKDGLERADNQPYTIQPQVHAQLAEKADIPGRYYRKMLGGPVEDRNLLVTNLNHWWGNETGKRRLVRCVDRDIRAVLSDRYRPISHLDLLTTAVQVITGQYVFDTNKTWAKGARCFSWQMSPTKMDVSLVNPCIWATMDDKEPQVGTINDSEMDWEQFNGWHTWMKSTKKGGVFPACRIRNSETGHGGLTVEGGLYEAVCDNTAHVGVSLAQIHLGKQLQEGMLQEMWSAQTIKKQNQVIFSKVADIIRGVFNPDELLKNVKKFKSLEDIAVENVTNAAGRVSELSGMTEGVRDEILAFYNSSTQARGNLYDFTRAVTGAAHAFRQEKPDVASGLESLGGQFIKRGEAQLVELKG